MAKQNVHRTIAMAGILVLSILACKDQGKEKNVRGSGLATAVPSPNHEASWDSSATDKKCFSNKGLTYDVLVTIEQNADNTVSGTVESKELETENTESASFTGTVKGNSFTIKFEAKPPIVGKASQWTDKAWTLVEEVGKSSFPHLLHIPFKAKNYDTNKWEDTEYIFAPVTCQ